MEDSVLRYDAVSYAMRSTKYEPSSMLTYFHGLLGIANIAMCSNMATVLVECTMEDQWISDPVFVIRGCEMFWNILEFNEWPRQHISVNQAVSAVTISHGEVV